MMVEYQNKHGIGYLEKVETKIFVNVFTEPIDFYHITKEDVFCITDNACMKNQMIIYSLGTVVSEEWPIYTI